MATKELHWQSENECLLIDIVKNDEYGWDIQLKEFPTTGLMGSYNDFQKLVNDITPFILTNMTQDERIRFAEELKQLV